MNYIIRFTIGLIALLFLSCTNSKNNTTSQPKNDSIKKYLELASNDTIAFHQRNLYNKKAFSFIDLNKNDTLTRWYLFKITLNSCQTTDKVDYSKTIKIFSKKAYNIKDTLSIARYYRLKGSYSSRKKVFDSAFYYFLKAEKFYKKTNDIIGLGEVYLFKGIVQNNTYEYLGSELSINKALTIFNKKNYNKRKYHCYNALGNTYQCLKEYNKAIECHQKALKLARLIKTGHSFENNQVGTSLNNIGNIYRELEDYKKAVYYFKKGIKNELKTKKDPELLGYLYENIGYCYFKLKKNIAESFLQKSLKILLHYNNKSEAGIVNMYLSQIYNEKADVTKAKEYSDSSLKLTNDSKERYYYLTALSFAGTINIQKAPFYLQEYHRLNDSLLFAERTARNQFYKIQLDVDQITQEKETAIKQKWEIVTILSGLLLIAILLFVIFRQKAKNKETALIQHQQKANEETYQMLLNQQALQEEAKTDEKKRIALELHDNILNKF